MNKYSNLFKPLKINNLVLKNRIISAPLGSLTDKSLSGIGMIVRGTCGSVPHSKARVAPGPYCFANMHESQKCREQVITIKQQDAKAEFELCHVGLYAHVEKGDYALGPCDMVRTDGTHVKAMNEQEMEEVADAFAQGAKDAKEYGFDVVMLHFAHGWLPTQFLSPNYNHRTDEYGGSLENRMKFPIKIVEKVRRAVGPSYPLDMRISVDEHLGIDNSDEIITFLQRVEPLIDMVHISCGLEHEGKPMAYMSTPTYYPHMINVETSAKVKKALHIPVAVVGGIMTPEEADNIIATGKADAVVIGRSLIADPWWVKKAYEGHSEDITPCLRCLNCYNMNGFDPTKYGMKNIYGCSVNPRFLHEDRVPNKLEKAEIKRKVVIVGGGPAGMKAAITAAQRGHDVDLHEMSERLGGQLKCSDYDSAKQDLKRYKDFLIVQIGKYPNIRVHLNSKLTPSSNEIKGADALILALGAEPRSIPVAGQETAHMMNSIYAYAHQDEIKDNVLIIGGGSVGAELAKCLSETKKHVTVVEIGPEICNNLNQYAKTGLLDVISKKDNIDIYTSTKVVKVNGNTATLADKNGREFSIAADTVIMSVGMVSKRNEANEFYGTVDNTCLIGDVNRTGTVMDATSDGYYVAANL